jgi:hypothetical protein
MENQPIRKIRYKDLSGTLKVAIIVSYILLVIWGLVFLVAFIEGIISG